MFWKWNSRFVFFSSAYEASSSAVSRRWRISSVCASWLTSRTSAACLLLVSADVAHGGVGQNACSVCCTASLIRYSPEPTPWYGVAESRPNWSVSGAA